MRSGHSASSRVPDAKRRKEITKLEAALSQIETAIFIYFHNGDPVSVHSLAANAYEIVCVLCESKGLSSPRLRQMLGPEVTEEISRSLREPQNFFKHGHRDKDASIGFSTVEGELLIHLATFGYRQLTDEWRPVLEAFHLWWKPPGIKRLKEDRPIEGRMAPSKRLEFFYVALLIWHKVLPKSIPRWMMAAIPPHIRLPVQYCATRSPSVRSLVRKFKPKSP
jgi:hypothetical protein